MIGLLRCAIALGGEHTPDRAIIPFPTGRIMFADFPGITCLATIIESLPG
jgi:hypothetical protein